jgi:hypothetical protein
MTPEQYTRTYLPGARRVTALEKLSATVAQRSLGLVVGGATGAFLIASIGVSAHTGALPFGRPPSAYQSLGDATVSLAGAGPRVTSEPKDPPQTSSTPETSPTPQTASKPEVASKSEIASKPATTWKPEGWSKPAQPSENHDSSASGHHK